jgi:hypothetical protein
MRYVDDATGLLHRLHLISIVHNQFQIFLEKLLAVSTSHMTCIKDLAFRLTLRVRYRLVA